MTSPHMLTNSYGPVLFSLSEHLTRLIDTNQLFSAQNNVKEYDQ